MSDKPLYQVGFYVKVTRLPDWPRPATEAEVREACAEFGWAPVETVETGGTWDLCLVELTPGVAAILETMGSISVTARNGVTATAQMP